MRFSEQTNLLSSSEMWNILWSSLIHISFLFKVESWNWNFCRIICTSTSLYRNKFYSTLCDRWSLKFVVNADFAVRRITINLGCEKTEQAVLQSQNLPANIHYFCFLEIVEIRRWNLSANECSKIFEVWIVSSYATRNNTNNLNVYLGWRPSTTQSWFISGRIRSIE